MLQLTCQKTGLGYNSPISASALPALPSPCCLPLSLCLLPFQDKDHLSIPAEHPGAFWQQLGFLGAPPTQTTTTFKVPLRTQLLRGQVQVSPTPFSPSLLATPTWQLVKNTLWAFQVCWRELPDIFPPTPPCARSLISWRWDKLRVESSAITWL